MPSKNSPSKRRKRSRPRPDKRRYVEFGMKVVVPNGTTREAVKLELMRRTREHDKSPLPKGWDVIIRWRNKPDAPFREDEFTRAMEESEGTTGWDGAVLGWLGRM